MSNGFAPPTPVLPSPVAARMGPGDVTPSVRPFVAALTPTTGHSAPPPRIGTLALAGAARSSVSLRTGAAGSHVPNERLCRSRAASMPEVPSRRLLDLAGGVSGVVTLPVQAARS